MTYDSAGCDPVATTCTACWLLLIAGLAQETPTGAGLPITVVNLLGFYRECSGDESSECCGEVGRLSTGDRIG